MASNSQWQTDPGNPRPEGWGGCQTLESRLERLIERTMSDDARELSEGGNFFAGAKLVLAAMRLKWELTAAAGRN